MALKKGHYALVFTRTEWRIISIFAYGRGLSRRPREIMGAIQMQGAVIQVYYLPVRKSKLSGWLRPSMMTCKVWTVVCKLSAIFSMPSFSRNEFIFCSISGFPISHSVPLMNDKNLQGQKKKAQHVLIILLILQIWLIFQQAARKFIHLRSMYH